MICRFFVQNKKNRKFNTKSISNGAGAKDIKRPKKLFTSVIMPTAHTHTHTRVYISVHTHTHTHTHDLCASGKLQPLCGKTKTMETGERNPASLIIRLIEYKWITDDDFKMEGCVWP